MNDSFGQAGYELFHHSIKRINAFLDIKAAYDSVGRRIMFRKCVAKGINLTLVEVLRQLYDERQLAIVGSVARKTGRMK